MKKLIIFFIAFLVFINCAFSKANSKKEKKQTVKTVSIQKGVTKISVASPTLNGEFYDYEEWIPFFIQGQLTSNLQNYSDFAVIDRLAAEQLMEEQKIMETEAAINEVDVPINYAKAISVDYVVTVNVTKKEDTYAMESNICSVNKATPVGKAFKKADITPQEMNDGYIINEMAYELLLGIGIDENGLADLLKHDENSLKTIEAQTNLSKGIAAEKKEKNIEAMTYYLKATSSDKNLNEAIARLSKTSVKIYGGDYVKEAGNKMAFRNQWVKLLQQTVETLEKVPPVQYVYKVNNNDSKISVDGYFVFTDEWKIINKLKNTLTKIPESSNWGREVSEFPQYQMSTNSWMNGGEFNVQISLRDEDSNVIQTDIQKIRISSNEIKNASFNKALNSSFIIENTDDPQTKDKFYISVDNISFNNEKIDISIIPMKSGVASYLGIGLSDNLETDLIIRYVVPKSPAAKAGIKKGDMIIGLDEDQFSSIKINTFLNMLKYNGSERTGYNIVEDYYFSTLSSGDSIRLLISHNGMKQIVDVELISYEQLMELIMKSTSKFKKRLEIRMMTKNKNSSVGDDEKKRIALELANDLYQTPADYFVNEGFDSVIKVLEGIEGKRLNEKAPDIKHYSGKMF